MMRTVLLKMKILIQGFSIPVHDIDLDDLSLQFFGYTCTCP